MKHNFPCPLIKDLLPLYLNGNTSAETSELIEDHLRSCSSCCACFHSLQKIRDEEADSIDDQKGETARYLVIARKIKQRKIITSLSVAALFILALVLTFQIFTPVLISGQSMSPAMQDGKIAVLDKITYTFSSPKRYDVIAYQKDGVLCVGRIIALPGETVQMTGGTIYADDVPLHHASLSGLSLDPIMPELGISAAGQYVIIKDNDLEAAPLLIEPDDVVGHFHVK